MPHPPAFTCPRCNHAIEVTSAMSAQLEARIRADFEARAVEQRRAIEARENALARQAAAVEAAKEGLEAELQKRLARERKAAEERLRAEARETARAEAALELTDAKSNLQRLQERLTQAQQAELLLRKQQAELEEQKREMELTKQREIDAMRQALIEKTRLEVTESYRLSVAEKEKTIEGMRKQIEDLRQKAIQGSQQTQGEVQELDLESLLRSSFPHDTFEPVSTGIHGADIIQRVHNAQGMPVGTILWEAKRTKAWSDGWLPKLRKDQRQINADVAVLMTHALPKEVSSFKAIDGVWVTGTTCAIALAGVVRHGVIEVAQARMAATGRQTKTELVYAYLTGPLFRQRVEAILEAWKSMQDDLEAEKRALTKHWAKRAKQIDMAFAGTAGLYGDLQGIAGKSVLEVKALEMPCLELGASVS